MAPGSLHFKKGSGRKKKKGEDKNFTVLKILVYVKSFGKLLFLRTSLLLAYPSKKQDPIIEFHIDILGILVYIFSFGPII